MVDSARGSQGSGPFSVRPAQRVDKGTLPYDPPPSSRAPQARPRDRPMPAVPKTPPAPKPAVTTADDRPQVVVSPRGERLAASYLKRVLTARVYDVARETALEPARSLSRRLGNPVLLKREDQQPVFSFKLRGAYNKMAHLAPDRLAAGVICASAGNHAQGVALSAKRLGCRAVIVMPVTTPKLKVDAVAALGGEVVLHGDSYTDAHGHALTLQAAQGLTFVHPFDDPDVIAGQGTVAMEILRQHQGPMHAVFVAIGGGGLIAGVAAYIKAVRPEVRVIGVQTADSNAMVQSIERGRRVQLADVGLFSDGTAVKLVGEETFRVARALVDAPAMQAADQARLGAEAGVRQADRALNPTLDVTAENLLGSGFYSGIGRSETTFALSQRLEWGEDRQARTSLAAADITIARANGDIRRQDLLYQVELAYLAAQKAEADLAVALERAEIAREIVATVERRVDAARDPLMAGAKAQTVLADAEISVENARRISQSAKMRLASFWGGDTTFSVDMTAYGVAFAPSPSLSTQLASPELALAQAEAGRAAAVVGVERARAEQDPTISGGFRYFQETGEVALVVGVSIPLTFADQNDGAIARAYAETSRLRFEGEALRRNIEREANTARSQMDIAQAEVEAIDARLLPSAEQALAYAQQGYSAGGFSYLDVLDAQRLVVQARLQRNSALHSFHSARVALARLTGAHAEGSAQ